MKTFLSSTHPNLHYRKILTSTYKILVIVLLTTAFAQVCTGQSWIYVGTPGFSVNGDDYNSLAIDATSGTPYISYSDGGFSGEATVSKYNGTSWVLVGTGGFSAGQAL